jgi:5-oxoprolinase (ATP-hydrolysing)
MKDDFWKIWIDTGGTFTDCLAVSPTGKLSRLKLLSSGVLRGNVIDVLSPTSIRVGIQFNSERDVFKGFVIRFLEGAIRERVVEKVDIQNNIIQFTKPLNNLKRNTFFELATNEEVPVLAARLLTSTSLSDLFPAIHLKLGSTKGTNALLERKGARTAFLITRGFRDLLAIGNQQRPHLFSLDIRKPAPLYAFVEEVLERIDSDGKVITELTQAEIQRIIQFVKVKRVQSVAIAFVNSYKNSRHELMLMNALLKAGVQFISLSHQLSSQIKILPRAETTVSNAYLHPVIHHYVSRIEKQLPLKEFDIMSSAGGLLQASNFQPKDSLLSGPAGGVIGAIEKARLSGVDKIITFDMGGTSTDVSLSNGRPEFRFESVVGDMKILSPSIAIETIAAGGGSICDFDGFRFTVGPHSAGAFPGPACYGAGGPLTITDVNLLLGKLDDENFSIPIQRSESERQLLLIKNRIFNQTGKRYSNEVILDAFIQIANEKMAEAIRKVSIQQGFDPKNYSLVSFGGAGGQHACSLAEMLGVNKIVVPYDAGLLSAFGIGNAKKEQIAEGLILKPLSYFINTYNRIKESLYKEGVASFTKSGVKKNGIEILETLVYLRLKGQESSLEIAIDNPHLIKSTFRKEYKKIYGHWIDDREIEVESMRLRLGTISVQKKTNKLKQSVYRPKQIKQNNLFESGKWIKCPVYRWEEFHVGANLHGPAIIISNNATQFVGSNWTFKLDGHHNAILQSRQKKSVRKSIQSEEAELELYTNRFTAIAQEMGALLQRTAFSVNVKERLDFSCALLDGNGNLIVNAPHIPVHLGSLGVCVRSLMTQIEMLQGDVVITNHPAMGGSHLPDITLVKPVYYKGTRIGFVANRAHHAEIGGKQPGSMPADATTLAEEGVIINPMHLIKNGRANWDEIETVLTTSRYPTRALKENLADLNAALASLNQGEAALLELCSAYGVKQVRYFMQSLAGYTASLMRQRITGLPKSNYKATECLDDGSRLTVNIHRKAGKLVIDFSGSSKKHPGNLNATKAIVNSVVLYVLRLLLNKNVPLNEGLLSNVKIKIPTGLLNPVWQNDHTKSPAVVGGNTEVSQRLTDTLLKAFGLAACSQGTMNNFLFGNERFGYYETIGGGSGAGNGFAGADAVHQHMTNTRITDPEIMEWRYPIRVKRFAIRKNSGGKGKFKGGNGIIREILFRESLQVNVLTQHRVQAPYGLQGGESGSVGEQWLVTDNGKKQKLKPIDSCEVHPGDSIIIKTPGGGGWGYK